MTPRQIELVQDTFALVAPGGMEVTRLFYDRLFEIAPELRPLFADDLTEQSRKLLSTLRVAIIGLRKTGEIQGVLRHLGRLHATEHEVRASHYEPVGEALLWALERGLGDAFDDEVREAWAAAYTLVATTMADGAAGDAAVGAEDEVTGATTGPTA